VALRAWASALETFLPELSIGKEGRIGLRSLEEEAYEKRLREFVFDNAPESHLAIAHYFEDDWRKHAEDFVREQGLDLSEI
jgi:hypothetical protein